MEVDKSEEVSVSMQEQPAKKARFSKNKKSNWNKIDISETEKFLEQKRLNEIQFGGDISIQEDSSFFVIDKKGSTNKVAKSKSKFSKFRFSI